MYYEEIQCSNCIYCTGKFEEDNYCRYHSIKYSCIKDEFREYDEREEEEK